MKWPLPTLELFFSFLFIFHFSFPLPSLFYLSSHQKMLQPSQPLYAPGIWRKQKFNSSRYAFLYLKTKEINLALFLLNLFFCGFGFLLLFLSLGKERKSGCFTMRALHRDTNITRNQVFTLSFYRVGAI